MTISSGSAKRPNILIIGPVPPPYHGVAVSTELLLRSQAFEHFQLVHLDTSDRRGIGNIGAFELGNVLLGLRHSLKFLLLVTGSRPRLVYLPISQGTGGYLRDLAFLLPCRWLGMSVVVHLRGSEFRAFYLSRSRIMRALIRYSLANVRRVIVLGEGLRSLFEGILPLDRVAVVPNGTPDFAAGLISFEKPGTRVRGLFLSNLRIRKGLFVALEAAIEALGRFSELEFYFAGEWQSSVVREQALTMAHDWLATNRLHFCGVVAGDEKHRLLLSSDFLVFPPIEPEGHPRVVLEAMAAGLPIVTTPQGAIVETVVDGKTGFMVKPGNAAAVADKITYLVEHPEIRRAMGQAGRERFLKRYTAEASAARLADVFVHVLAES